MLVVSNHSVDREQDWPSISRRNYLHPLILTKGGDHPNKQTAQIAELRRNSGTSIISVSPPCGGKANRGISESLSVCVCAWEDREGRGEGAPRSLFAYS